MRDRRAAVVPGEFAISEAEPRDRTAEAVIVDAHEVEARLDRQCAQRGADRLAFDLQGARRKVGVAHLAFALELDGTDDRAVGSDAARAARSFEAGVIEHLADDETAGFVRAHLAGHGRQGSKKAERYHHPTQHRQTPLTPPTTTDRNLLKAARVCPPFVAKS